MTKTPKTVNRGTNKRVIFVQLRKLPFVTGMAYIPLEQISDVTALKTKLTINDMNFVASQYAGETVESSVICYDESVDGYLGLPRQYAFDNFPGIRFVDRTVRGMPHLASLFPDFKNKITPRDDEQREFMESLANICTKPGIQDVIANATTGAGKTVSDLWLNAQMGVPTLIIVPRNHLLEQWIGSTELGRGIANFFGDDFVQKYVGITQQNVCDYEGKMFVVGMLQSLAKRDYGQDFYRYFGKVTIDEVHKCATPVLSQALMKFPQRVRIGYTATNKKGALRKVCDMHLGKPKVISEQEVMKPIVYLCPFKARIKFWGHTDAQILASMSTNELRNQAIAKLIYKRGYCRRRNVIVFSDKVKQLQILQDMLIDLGARDEHVGLYVGEAYDRNSRGGFTNNKTKVPSEELNRVAKDCKIILATFGIFDTGGDIPRLDMGVEASPSRTDLEQAVGRIVRLKEGKATPEWYSIVDDISYTETYLDGRGTIEKRYSFLTKKVKTRMKSFKKKGATIKRVRNEI